MQHLGARTVAMQEPGMPLLVVLTMWLMLCGPSGCCEEKSGSSWPVDPPPTAACLGRGPRLPRGWGRSWGWGGARCPRLEIYP